SVGTPRRFLSGWRSALSTTRTGKPALRRCSAQPLQQPQLGSLVTVIDGKSAPRAPIGTAPPSTVAAISARLDRREGISRSILVLLKASLRSRAICRARSAVGATKHIHELLNLAMLVFRVAAQHGLLDTLADVLAQQLLLDALEGRAHGGDLGD